MLQSQPERRAKVTTYTPAMLYQSAEATVEFSSASIQRLAGWVFGQFYNSLKEIYDVGKVKPFQASFLDKLSWDPDVRTMLEKRGRAVLATASQLKGSYLYSKKRASQALEAATLWSYGVREEHRVSLAFLDRMIAALRDMDLWDQPAQRVCPEIPYWHINTADYLAFLRSNINKFAFGIEWILGQQSNQSISYGHSMVLRMLIQGLQSSYDSIDPTRTPGLWQTSYEAGPAKARQLRRGMGLKQSMERYGYGWLVSGMDWEHLVFRTDFAKVSGYQDTALWDTYQRRWPAVKDAKDDLKKFEVLGLWLSLYRTSEDLCSQVLGLMMGLLYQVFRKDFFLSIKDLVDPKYVEDAVAGKIMLCSDALNQVLTPYASRYGWEGLEIKYPDRTKVQSLQDLVDLLWDLDDGQERGRWEKYAYRVLYKRALELCRQHLGAQYVRKVEQVVKREFVLFHWILPFPNSQRFWRRVGGARQYVAVQTVRTLYQPECGERVPYAWLKGLNRVEEKTWLTEGPPNQPDASLAIRRRKLGWMPAWRLTTEHSGYSSYLKRPLSGVPQLPAELAIYSEAEWQAVENRLRIQSKEEGL